MAKPSATAYASGRHVPRVATWCGLSLMLVGCSGMLPAVPDTGELALRAAWPATTIEVEGSAGPVAVHEARAALDTARAEGRAQAFDHHLAILRGEGESLIAGNEVDLLVDGPATFEAMFDDMSQASERILLQTYIFEAEEIGRRIADTLLEKSREGLDVRVVYDSVGSFLTPASFFAELREGGIAVCEFNPVSPWRRATGILTLNHRDHRKLLVVDDQAAFTGGINVSGVYASGSIALSGRLPDQEDAGWRDTHARIRGPAVRAFTQLFDDTWQRQRCDATRPPLPELAPPQVGDKLVAVIGSVADADSSRLYRALLAAVNGATESVHITMAYFVPDPQTVRVLADAARRGVEVMLVLPGHSDFLLALRAGQSHYTTLLEAGVRIFELHEAFLHAKTVVIDGVWSTVGSSNLDWRSFLHNDELNAIVLGREFGMEMERQFQDDLSRAEEVTLEQWRRRGPVRRFMEGFGRLWEYWM